MTHVRTKLDRMATGIASTTNGKFLMRLKSRVKLKAGNWWPSDHRRHWIYCRLLAISRKIISGWAPQIVAPQNVPARTDSSGFTMWLDLPNSFSKTGIQESLTDRILRKIAWDCKLDNQFSYKQLWLNSCIPRTSVSYLDLQLIF